MASYTILGDELVYVCVCGLFVFLKFKLRLHMNYYNLKLDKIKELK